MLKTRVLSFDPEFRWEKNFENNQISMSLVYPTGFLNMEVVANFEIVYVIFHVQF